MKHKLSITLLLMGMFLLTQLIGLMVVKSYMTQTLPYDLQIQPDEPQPGILSLMFSFALAFALIFILMKYRFKLVMKLWFLFVVVLALSVSLSAFLLPYVSNAHLIAMILAVPLAILKVKRPHFLIHNATELLIYPGIAAIFVQFLSIPTVILLLIFISVYDMWAVWHTGVMQKMAKYQMEELNIFGGFLLPSASKKVLLQIKSIKEKYKGKELPKSVRSQKFRINFAILGGGDVVFPIITSGVFLKTIGVIPALFVMGGALLGLGYLFSITKKDKAYPAMPYITVGIFIGLALWWLFF